MENENETPEYNSIEEFLEDNQDVDTLVYLVETLLERVLDLQVFIKEKGYSEEEFLRWQNLKETNQDYMM